MTMHDHELGDAERYPTLTEHGRQMLKRLREDAHAPVFRNHAGNRLIAEDLTQVRALDAEVGTARVGWPLAARPAWLAGFAARTYQDVPFFRMRGSLPERFEDIPPTARADLAENNALFVPDSVPLDRLINFRTSGTTGHPLLIPSHPQVAASYLPFHKRALRRFDVEPRAARGEVCVALLGYQRQCFTYASVTPAMDDAGYVKLNLHPADWRDPADRSRYLDAIQPEIFSGDPMSFTALLELPLTWKPRALVSTSMTLLPALRTALETRFECPVLDVYSLSECGPVAVYDASKGGHVLLQHQLYVEVLDEAGHICTPGQRGEITLTGGFNFCLPLLRYRTGDYAALDFGGNEPVLKDLHGRAPVRFRAPDGAWINNIELTHALRPLPLRQFRLHQTADGALVFEYAASDTLDQAITQTLRSLFGPKVMFTITRRVFDGAKLVQYSTELT